MKNAIFTLLFFVSCFFNILNAQQSEIKVVVSGIDTIAGTLYIGLYNDKAGFMNTDSAFRKKLIKVDDSLAHLQFFSLSEGNYAIAVFQDINNNGILDQGLFGIPVEPFGFSNNPKLNFGPPGYKKAKFFLEKKATILIKMKTFSFELLK